MSSAAINGDAASVRDTGAIPEVSLYLSNLDERSALEVARAGEAAGFSRVWIADTPHVDPGGLGAVIAQGTSLEVGTGVIGAFSRSPAALACMVATWAGLAGDGRLLHIGVGAGGPVPVERWHGVKYAKPVETVRDTIAILRQAFAGARTDYAGATRSSHRFELPGGGVPSARLYVGGLGPRMRALAAQVADGLILSWATEAAVARARRDLHADLAAAGRGRGAVRLIARAYVDVCEDTAAARAGVSEEIVQYAMAPPYARYFADIGFRDDVAAISEAFARGDRDATSRAAAARMTDEFLLAGPIERVVERLGGYLGSGVDEVVLQPVPAFRGGDPVRTAGSLGALFGPVHAAPSRRAGDSMRKEHHE
jgi:alkanesulfonate monooxygenase SsuD/methylene tetrahydromethanopterin reductase-like flavin-dependent oxidoreductase (luciferase family)